MSSDRNVVTLRVEDEAGRRDVIDILRATYHAEKRWVSDPAGQFPASDLTRQDISWFVVRIEGKPVGVLRVFYNPPLAEYAKYGFKLLDTAPDINEFLRDNRVAEIGRFAVLPEFRGKIVLATALMGRATEETLERGFTHFVTDVFEDDPHSPFGFHTRVMGFRAVATHDVGELHSRSRRITMILDLKAAYMRLRARRNWVFRYLTGSWAEALHQRLVA
jgi:ribosomal protein S18 acetylase RimI-like enzyme